MEYLIPLFDRYAEMARTAPSEVFPQHDKCGRSHIINLCEEAKKGIATASMPSDKLFRWLGFIQGILCASGLVTVDGERDYTRPIFNPSSDGEK